MDTGAIVTLLVEALLIGGILLFAWRQRRRTAEPALAVKPRQGAQEVEKLRRLRERHLNEPLSELSRPARLEDIVGQQEGIRALRAALCGPNPQHVILYGPPGVGKTCAARLVLEEAKTRPDSPFTEQSEFVEMDATCIRFDERAIADPLIGSVHDPIYQGAGALGSRGVPQPKPGAVTRAHCGVLFLDEIGELHPMQMNKLLKVLEDRRVRFESAYYSPDNAGIPAHIHDIFENGLPADFRLIGATTRPPEELPAALRSRCLELHFRTLSAAELVRIAEGAALRAGFALPEAAAEQCAKYAQSGRDAVNIVQLAAGLAYNEGRGEIRTSDVSWVARTCNYAPRPEKKLPPTARVGVVAMLAVAGADTGIALELECVVKKSRHPRLVLSGIVETEELEQKNRRLTKQSTARCSAENVLTSVGTMLGIDFSELDVRFNIPGAPPTDGPSAGIALAIALLSAVRGKPPHAQLAATGEVTIHGDVRAVGGVREKVSAAAEAGAKIVIIPAENDEPELHQMGATVIGVRSLDEAFGRAFDEFDSSSSTEKSLLAHCTI